MFAFHMISLILVFLDPVGCQDQVTDTRLDIVFLLDQERTNLSMLGSELNKEFCVYMPAEFQCTRLFDEYENCSNNNMAYSGIKTWMTSFFDKAGADDTQFAVVVGCGVGNTAYVMHHFINGSFKAMIPTALDDGERGIKKGCPKNLDQMMQLADNDVFGPLMGHRNESTAIAIVVSDCVQESPSQFEKVKADCTKFLQKPKRKLYFICVSFKPPCANLYTNEIGRFKKEMVGILSETTQQTSQSVMYLDPNSQDVGQLLDQLFPKRSGVKDVNCNESWLCGNCNGSGSCEQQCLWTHYSLPTGIGKTCTEKRSFARSCACPPTTAQPTVSRKWPIVLGVCGLLFLAVVILVVVVCCIHGKRSKNRAKDVAVAVRVKQAPEKKAEVAVDLSMMQSTMGVRSKVKFMSRKRSMFKTISKRGSVVKMLPVSKPIGKSAKSISKTKGGESTSKPSKSMTGKNAKSTAGQAKKSMAPKSIAGQSKKSVAQKSVATKSQMSKTQKLVAN